MKNILIFNDISGLGNCSMVANLAVFNKLGHYCMPVVTSMYSCQTGFDNYVSRQNQCVLDYAERILANRQTDAVYVGFCDKTDVVDSIMQFLSFKSGTKRFVLVDPILGDNGKLYPVFDDDYVASVKRLIPLADVITPNLTEACLLCNVDYFQLHSLCSGNILQACKDAFADILSVTGAKSAVITGISLENEICNLVFDGAGASFVRNKRVNVNYSGTGDLFSTVLLGKLLNGESLLSATQIAADFVAAAAEATECSDRRFGLEFGRVLDKLN